LTPPRQSAHGVGRSAVIDQCCIRHDEPALRSACVTGSKIMIFFGFVQDQRDSAAARGDLGAGVLCSKQQQKQAL